MPQGEQVSRLRFTDIDCKQLGRRRPASRWSSLKPALFLGTAISVVAAGGYFGYEPTERALHRAVASLSAPDVAPAVRAPSAPAPASLDTPPSIADVGGIVSPEPVVAPSDIETADALQETDVPTPSDLLAGGELQPVQPELTQIRSEPTFTDPPDQLTGVSARLVPEQEPKPSLFARLRGLFQPDDRGRSADSQRVAGQSWSGMEIWMEPFMPFPMTGSIDQIVADMVARMPAPHQGYERVVVQSGESLARILSRKGIGPGTQHAILQSGADVQVLSRLHPGDEIFLSIDDDNRLAGLRFPVSNSRMLIIQHSETSDGYISRFEDQPYETRRLQASGTIDRSLYLSARAAGLSHRQIMEFMNIFEWQIDFTRETRRGDTFSVIFEAEFVDGQRVRDGRIVAAAFVNAGRRHEAVYYETPDGSVRGYFDADGRNMMKAFIRKPVQNAWISSHFDRNRLHPILGVRRPHLGTDFAAPTGTPILAAGDGRVVSAGRNGGYGNAIVIEHGSQIRTLYAHLSRFESGITAGTRVEQGQVIGYVGATGLATGPHLHYEFKINGQHQDPMRVELPSGDPVPGQHLAHFQSNTASLLATLDRLSDTQIAMRRSD